MKYILIAFATGAIFGAVFCDLLSHAASDDYWLGYEDRQLHENYQHDPYGPMFQYNRPHDGWPQGEYKPKPC